jgi:hypothetical protein
VLRMVVVRNPLWSGPKVLRTFTTSGPCTNGKERPLVHSADVV